MKIKGAFGLIAAVLFATTARAQVLKVDVHSVTPQGEGPSLGTVIIHDMGQGVMIMPDLKGLPPGVHGFHIHEHSDCGPAETDGKMQAAMKAGDHYDPGKTGKHEGPQGAGHKGDLPVLEVAPDGTATKSIDLSRFKVADIRNRTLVIHEGGDNYSDTPKPLGGGGARIACGIIK